MTTKTQPRRVLTERQYEELCRLVREARTTARAMEAAQLRRDIYSDDERKAADDTDRAAMEAVFGRLADLTKWDT